MQRAYLAGELHLLPFPGSLVFWGAPAYQQLQQELPLAVQIPLLHLVARHEGWHGLRVPQSGWLHEPRPGQPSSRATSTARSATPSSAPHRWAKVLPRRGRAGPDATARTSWPTSCSAPLPDDVGLYDKPMARNVQLWTHDFRLLLDGPHGHARRD